MSIIDKIRGIFEAYDKKSASIDSQCDSGQISSSERNSQKAEAARETTSANLAANKTVSGTKRHWS